MAPRSVAGPDARLALRLTPGGAFFLLLLLWVAMLVVLFLIFGPA